MAFFESWSDLECVIEGHRSELLARPIMPTLTTGAIRQRLHEEFSFASPMPMSEVISRVAHLLGEGLVHTTHPQYFGLYNPDVHPAAVASEALIAAYNPQLAAYSHAPSANEMEQHALRVFLDHLGWTEGVGTFTSGGSEANHTAMIVGLTHRVPGFAEEGLGAVRPRVYVSAEAHHSLVKMAHACGIGRGAVRAIPADSQLRMEVAALRAAIRQDQEAGWLPSIVVATAGTTSAGGVDPMVEIATVAAEEGLWLHVDAAWGGAALLSPELRPHLTGIERADSVTIDAHKWLSVPMGTGMIFCREGRAMNEAFRIQTAYMPKGSDAPDPYVTSLQWSRRHNGLKLFMTMAALGREGYARQIEHQSAMGTALARRLTEIGWEVVHLSPFAVVTFRPPTETDLDVLIERIYSRSKVWISKTTLSHHGAVLRACITHRESGPEHLEVLIEELQWASAGAN